ncbi:MAG: transcriptional repressor [Candidatus Schekmanbacteria bacterium RBG_13_48_7]|uniref:Transcriptional repressor n=1 Tax=Candidatus Schekmanbacteria bacterium RBG_13_48_7 TaxID=1817878 RepID=A0A1F7RNG0_9BACT|nr:MAG: transcriptional repressor [Candidatus Schekmanbacteria bacterium RBG_13_48_7]
MVTEQQFRLTHQRKVILEEIRGNRIHPTADKVYELVRKRLPRISLGTVYRNLELLSGQGLIQKLEFAGSQKRFDGELNNHYHVRCSECGCIGDISDSDVSINKSYDQEKEYIILGHRLEFIGICPACKNRSNRHG